MKYQVYQTTNKINGKVYIGKHQCSCKECNYFGSGKLLKRAIKKHGIDNFTKTILFEYDNEQDMVSKEKELVTEEFCNLDTNYNLCEGGKGGFGYINKNPNFEKQRIEKNQRAIRTTNNILKEKYGKNFKSIFAKKVFGDFLRNNPNHLEKIRKIYWKKYPKSFFYGKKHSDETKKRISEKQKKIDRIGNKNPNFGKMWITNEKEYTLINKNDIIPTGWRKGKIQPQNKNRILSGINSPIYGRIWISNGKINKLIKKDTIFPKGFKKGRTLKNNADVV